MMLSVENSIRKTLDKRMINNDKNIINNILNFVRCKDCGFIEDISCCCLRCDGPCFEKIKNGCQCYKYCNYCNKVKDDIPGMGFDCDVCGKSKRLCIDCEQQGIEIGIDAYGMLDLYDCQNCGSRYCSDKCKGEVSGVCKLCQIVLEPEYCRGDCHEDEGCSDCEYERMKENQIW